MDNSRNNNEFYAKVTFALLLVLAVALATILIVARQTMGRRAEFEGFNTNDCTEVSPDPRLDADENESNLQLDASSIVCVPERPKKIYIDPETGEELAVIEGDRALLEHPTAPSVGVCNISSGDKLIAVSNFKNFNSELFPSELEDGLDDNGIVAQIKGSGKYWEWVITVDYSKSSGDASNQNIASIAYDVATHMSQRSPK